MFKLEFVFCLFFIPQGIESDIVRYFAFFSYFTIQLAQLFLCCFADQPPEGKTVLEKVGLGECIPKPNVNTVFPFRGTNVIHLRPSFPTLN